MNKIIHDILSYSGKIIQKLNIQINPPLRFFGKSLYSEKSIPEYLEFLHSISEDKGESCIRKTPVLSTNEYDIQIIVPVYNTEKYLRNCLDSILCQRTDASFIITVINDGSTDNSATILESYKENPKVEIIHQPNKGLSGARNTGLDNLKGRYVMFVDSDDCLEDKAINTLYRKIIKEELDIAVGSHYSVDTNGKILKTNILKDDSIPGFAWGKLFKASLFSKLQFPINYWFEDTFISLIILFLTDKIGIVNKPVYNYHLNPNGISRTSSHKAKLLDTIYITQRLLKDRKILGYPHTQSFYNRILRQIRYNQIRLSTLKDTDIEKAHFFLAYDILKEYPEFSTTKKEYSLIEKSIRNRNFNAFLFACGN